MTTITGRVLDWITITPVPGATVELWAGNVKLKSVAADNNGTFELSTTAVPDHLQISSAGYTTRTFGFAEYENFWTFFIQPNYREGETPIVYATIPKKKNWLGVALLIGIIILAKKKNRK
jgi:hypothetical protein